MFAQKDGKTKGIIVQCEPKNISAFIHSIHQKRQSDIKYKSLGNQSELFLLTSDLFDTTLYDLCKDHPLITALEYNYELEQRIKPNDSKINEQYYLSLIKAYESWDITTGGKGYNGKDIVIGVIDDGYELSHEDLVSNIYSNPDEIAGDNIDNDNNGYKDDVSGWNTRSNNGIHDIKSHGTNILGVLGAKGNNQKGISGVNWNIKILPVTTGNLVSDVIEGYDYLLAEKKQYNLSGGTKGSNIVVSSYSGGLSKAFAADFPIWCGIYDKLGSEGIINVAATTNGNDNVEEVGDMPSTCTSPYLVIVNSTNQADEIDAATGYGNVSVDISAPGERILTTDLKSKGLYKTESGTSLSTPMVAGAVALLYSIKCQAFNALITQDPKNAALTVKSILLSSTDKKTSLTGKTVTEGRLNISESISKILEDYCSLELSPVGNLKINAATWTNGMLNVDYISEDAKEITLKLFDTSGKLVYIDKIIPPVFGEKKLSIQPGIQLPGMFYYVSLFSENKVASKGFNVQDPSK
jgi:subtilisin family serine protease